MITAISNIIRKKSINKTVPGLIVEKKFKSFQEFKSMSVFIIKLHDVDCSSLSVFLKKSGDYWVWQIEAENMSHEHYISLYENLNEMCLASESNQLVLNTSLPQTKVLIFKNF